MTTPVRYPSGVTTRDASHPFGQFFNPDPTRVHSYFNDFYVYSASDWVLTTTEVGAGSATEAIADDEVGGVLVITNAAGDGDHDNFQLSRDGGTNDSEIYTFATGKKAWFDTRFKSNDGDQITTHIGIHIVNTDPVNAAPTDGIYFKTTDETGDISLLVRKDSTETAAAGLGTLGDDTFVRLSYYWDGVDEIKAYVDGVLQSTLSSGNLPDDEAMALSFGVENGEASANTLEIDYVGIWMER